MKFAHDSLKLKSKAQNENFCFDIQTTQGHFFAVLDFAPHDYANLNATLASKLETVAGSFASLSKFSADLFLGFLAREINNFLHHLGEQSSGPEIFCSAALCLVGGSRLHYLICGDVRIDITGGRLLSLSGEAAEEIGVGVDLKTPEGSLARKPGLDRLGDGKLEAPLTDQVESFDLLDDDVVLIMTRGLEAGFDRRQLPRDLVDPVSPEPKYICEALIKASASSRDDRTVVVIAGPYDHDANPLLSDLTNAIALLEAKVNTLAEAEAVRAASAAVGPSGRAQSESDTGAELEALRADLTAKAAKDDLATFEEKLKALTSVLHVKASRDDLAGFDGKLETLSAAVRGTAAQDDLNRLEEKLQTLITVLQGKAGKEDLLEFDEKLTPLIAAIAGKADSADLLAFKHDVLKLNKVASAPPPVVEPREESRRFSIAPLLLLILLVAVGSAFLGAWLQSRVFRRAPESSNQLASVPTTVATPDSTLVSSQPPSSPAQPATSVAEVTVKPGDSLRKFAERYNVSLETIKEMNPSITKWNLIKPGQKINLPAQPQEQAQASPIPTPAPTTSVQPDPATSTGTIEVTVGPGDSLNRFAQRYNSTPQRLRELNPQVSNWASIRTGQKLVMPSPPG